MAASTSTEKAFVPGSDEQFILEKNSDCFLDMKSQKTWKRIVFGHGDFEPTSFHASKKPRTTLHDDDQIIDEDYKNFLHALNKYGEEQEKGKESAANDEDGDCYMDPAYKMFLDNLREDGRSYLLDISGIVHIKYKGENNTLSDGNGNNWETLKDKNKSNLATPREEDRKKSAIPTAKDRIGGGSSLNSESYHLSLNRRKLDDIAADFLAKRGKQPKSQNVGGETLLHSTKFATDSAVKLEDGDNQTLADTIKFVATNKLPVNSTKDVHPQRHAKRTIRIDNSQFREKLIEILRMPYNQREYEELLHKITDRKPMQRHRDLRGRIKVYDSSLLGKSYLDYYSDLAKRIDLVHRDRPKVLNLLRGFFYWLTNLSHDGAFQPWLDSSSLKIIPQVSRSN